ncbi:MAG: hypothetical protein II445_05595 [Muribaculaceae bacterium]|nr:hypothetical protein [Muribaculaceae bacterium]
MKQDLNNPQPQASESDTLPVTTGNEQHEPQAEAMQSSLDDIIGDMNISGSVAATAKAILEPLEKGTAPSKSIVELIVKALNHDEDVKNADAAGYLRGRNETIEAATRAIEEQEPQPITFPVYRKRSFWDK